MKEIEKIIEFYQQIDREKAKVALGTLVKVEGSAYRRIGARMFVSHTGKWVGGISGGCLEGDALKRAQIAILKNESSIIVYDTTEDDPHQIGVGLGCNGRIEVLFTPIDPADSNNQVEFLKNITNNRTPTILIQVLNINAGNNSLRGNFYAEKAIANLAQAINISEEKLTEKLKVVYLRGRSKVITFTNDAGASYEILYELIRPKIKLVCIGDNYDVKAFLGIGKELGWEVHVAGKRSKIGKEMYQSAQKVYSFEAAEKIIADDFTAIVLMSHDYKTDYRLLKKYIKLDIPYIGLLGPKTRMTKMQNQLLEEGSDSTLELMPHVFGPVGLDIGAESPEEIALSIAAEIISTFRKRDGGNLRKRPGTIHECS